jgi:hypothetical protein
MNWSWWSAELATAVTGPHSPGYMRNMAYEHKVNRGEELHQIFYAERRMNDPDVLRKVQNILNLKFPKNQTCIHMIFPTGNDLRNKL